MDILLVEDDDGVREVVTDLLTIVGYSVQAAVHGQHALELLKEGVNPRLILLDLMMPIMDGEAFMQHREKDVALKAIPVIIISATPQVLLTTTADGVVRKPFALEDLLPHLDKHCASRAA